MDAQLDLAIKAAWDAHARGDWLGAIDCWKRCLQLDPGITNAYWMAGALLLQEGRPQEADAVLSEGMRREPGHISMGIEHAKAATALKNWPEAVRRWNALTERAPDSSEVLRWRSTAEMQMRMEGLTDEQNAQLQFTNRPVADTELFMRFESLGDNCEFGLVQRQFHAEPLSLLRWSAITLDALIDGLADGFRSAGNAETTTLTVAHHGEYTLQDHRYGMAMHTFINAKMSAEDPAKLHTKMCRRLTFLRTKLTQDLADSSKIFVFKSNSGAPLERVKELHETMERYGRNRLFYVLEADSNRVVGSVEELSQRLFVGAIDHFVHSGQEWDTINFAGWRELCRKILDRYGEPVPAA